MDRTAPPQASFPHLGDAHCIRDAALQEQDAHSRGAMPYTRALGPVGVVPAEMEPLSESPSAVRPVLSLESYPLLLLPLPRRRSFFSVF